MFSMVSVLLALISGGVQLLSLYIKRRFDLKEIEAGRKKVVNGKLITSDTEVQQDGTTDANKSN